MQFADVEEKLSSGSIGIEVRIRCRMFGSVTNIGVIGLQHDCVVCRSLTEKFGTCEYMHQANPSRCTCFLTAPRKKTNVQTVLKTESTDRARLRYWRHWALTEGIRLGLTVLPDSTSTLSLAVEMPAQQATLDVAAVAEPAESLEPRRASQK